MFHFYLVHRKYNINLILIWYSVVFINVSIVHKNIFIGPFWYIPNHNTFNVKLFIYPLNFHFLFLYFLFSTTNKILQHWIDVRNKYFHPPISNKKYFNISTLRYDFPTIFQYILHMRLRKFSRTLKSYIMNVKLFHRFLFTS